MATPQTCSAKFKTGEQKGELCTKGAKYMVNGVPYCGIHVPKTDKTDSNLIESGSTSNKETKTRSKLVAGDAASAGSSPSSNSGATTRGGNVTSSKGSRKRAADAKEQLLDEIYDALVNRLETSDMGDVPEDTRFKLLETMPVQARRIIIGKAYEYAGTDDTLVIAKHIPDQVSNYQRASTAPRQIIEQEDHHNASIGGEIPDEETGYVEFPDVGILLANLREHPEIVNAENAIRVDQGTEWYIPLPPMFKLRSEYNQVAAREIIERIRKGEDNAERYLSLKDKILVCNCAPQPCHAEVYIHVIRAISEQVCESE